MMENKCDCLIEIKRPFRKTRSKFYTFLNYQDFILIVNLPSGIF